MRLRDHELDIELRGKTGKRMEENRIESNGDDEIIGVYRMERNRIEQNIARTRAKRKERNIRESVIGPQGAGPCA